MIELFRVLLKLNVTFYLAWMGLVLPELKVLVPELKVSHLLLPELCHRRYEVHHLEQ